MVSLANVAGSRQFNEREPLPRTGFLQARLYGLV